MTAPRRFKVGLYLNDTNANLEKFVRCLKQWNMAFESVWKDDLQRLAPGDVDVLLLHGGWYGIDRKPAQDQGDVRATEKNIRDAEAVRNFARAGGGVVGVCCGAYNVVWLGLLAAEISRMAGVGMHQLEVADAAHPIAREEIQRAEGRTDREWLAVPCLRVSGPILLPKNKGQMVFSYDWEQRLGAVVAGDFGKGRAVAVSPHPEMGENERGRELRDEPLMPASKILRSALLWSAGDQWLDGAGS